MRITPRRCCEISALHGYRSSSLNTQTNPNPINSLLKQLVQTNHFLQALERYAQIWSTGFIPDNFTFPYILKASTHLKDPTMGLLIHNTAIKTGFDSNIFVANSLILFYSQFSQVESIQYLFDQMPERNIVTWTAVISALAQNHQPHIAIGIFQEMLITGVKPNSFTMAALLPNFTSINGLHQLHSFLIKSGFGSDVFVLTALIDVYAKCGLIFLAHQVFNEIPERNVVSWNALILGYDQNGESHSSLKLFARMWSSCKVRPDSFSVVTVLHSCSVLTAIQSGRQIHCYALKVGLERNVFVCNALLDMYAKCGLLKLAERVFTQMQEKDVSSWTTLLTCYGLHGKGRKAIAIFEQMKQTMTPNSVTMTALLTACSHSCLVEEGIRYFETMTVELGIEPIIKHYACVVDLLGRAGLLEEALEFINKMPIQADARLWESLLGAATIHGNKAIIEISSSNILEMQSENPEVHVQVANMYANVGRWEEVAKVRGLAQSVKLPGLSYVIK